MTASDTTRHAIDAHRRGDLSQAEQLYSTALAMDPDVFEARHMFGALRIQQGRIDDAIELLAAALRLRPNDVHALRDAGAAFQEAGRLPEAIAHYGRALSIQADDFETVQRLGMAQMAHQDARAAAGTFRNAVALRPEDSAAYFNFGMAMQALGDYPQALQALDRAVALQPDSALALMVRARVASTLGLMEEAAHGFERAMALDPTQEDLLCDLAHGRGCLCDWRDFDAISAALVSAIRSGKRVSYPLVAVTLFDDPVLQLECARLISSQIATRVKARPSSRSASRSKRIRIAYLSPNYYEHAVAYLVAELLERHDRRRFEVTAVSFGPDGAGMVKSRIRSAVEHFVDALAISDAHVADMLREAGVDIAVDLAGYTAMARTGILAIRPAPIQVNYLGYPGTMGAKFIDYIIADHFVVPDDSMRFYSESVVRLPDCYQPNDTQRRIAPHAPSRAELGLPERGFVFCSFNNSFKITPPIFDIWMRLLRAVEGSVLWLLDTSASAKRNLAKEATVRGVSAERLMFAPRIMHAEHLARHRAADLFLDTLPYNAHTTASDALWVGLPVLTCSGLSFASRVAGSLLNAIGLQALVTTSLADYEALALALARDPARLATLRRQLAHALPTAPLFDIDRYRRHLEAAYETMWARHLSGEPPGAFDVAPLR